MFESTGITPINKMSSYIDTSNITAARHIYGVLQAEGSPYKVLNEKDAISADPDDFTIDSRFIDFGGNNLHQISSLGVWVQRLAEFAIEPFVSEPDIRQIAIGIAALFAQRDIDQALVASYDRLNESVRGVVHHG